MFEKSGAIAAFVLSAIRGLPPSRFVFSSVQRTFVLAVFVALGTAGFAHANDIPITAARVWPATDYTRFTFESKKPIAYKLFSLKHPDRLVLDLEDVDLGTALKALTAKVDASDPYVKSLRVGQFKPGVVRLVFDLKAEVKPQAFALSPVGQYGDRLVLDLYPLVPVDPLLAFLDQRHALSAAPAAPATQQSPAPQAVEPERHSTEIARADGDGKAAPEKTTLRMHRPRGADAAPTRPVIVAIDPGHGGEDPGAEGPGGTYEKNVTLAIARKLKARIDEDPDMRAALTRNGDYFIPLQMRVQKARRMHADLFVSIHADAFVNREARGSSVFALSERGATSAAARWLAKSENQSDLIGGVNLDVPDPYLKRTLLDLSQTATINDSLKLARDVLGQIGEIGPLHTGRVDQAGFAVLKAPDIPSILVETAFISNPREERKLRSPRFQEEMADAIYAGIKRYLSLNPPLARDHIVMNP